MRNGWCAVLVWMLVTLFGAASTTNAQVLIWNVPKDDGTWIRFEGNYRQTQTRPNAAGDIVLEWRQELTMSSVGEKEAEYKGKQVPCRWIEFKSVTKPAGVDQPPGPGGTYLYKVLIPIEAVIGKPVDDESVPVTFLPVIEGVRKVGDRPIEKVNEKALAVYPHISQLTYYPDLQPTGNEDVLSIANDSHQAKIFKGSRLLEDKRSRSKNAASLWLTNTLPFGIAKFSVNVERDAKLPTVSPDEFKRVSVIDVEMVAVETGTGARSELADAE